MRLTVFNRVVTLALGMIAVPAVAGEPRHTWPDDFVGRLEVLAVIEELNGALLASPSATTTLEAWCADHHMASPPKIVALRDRGANSPASSEIRASLQVTPDEPVKYRRVSLACGTHILSEAENWYVPSRLTASMNAALDTTDTPFGRVVEPLNVTRQTLSAEPLWSPLPKDWERKPDLVRTHYARAAHTIPLEILRHRALVYDNAHRPLAEVVETYTNAVLDFPH